jgi:hypothetical protein
MGVGRDVEDRPNGCLAVAKRPDQMQTLLSVKPGKPTIMVEGECARQLDRLLITINPPYQTTAYAKAEAFDG